MHLDANAWGSGVVGAIIGSGFSFWLTSFYNSHQKENERQEYLQILKQQLRDTIAVPVPTVAKFDELPVWPDRGCSIVPAILQRNLFNRTKDTAFVAIVTKLSSNLETYRSHVQISATITAGSLSIIGSSGAIERNMEAVYHMMTRQFQQVTLMAQLTLEVSNSNYASRPSAWNKLVAVTRKIATELRKAEQNF